MQFWNGRDSNKSGESPRTSDLQGLSLLNLNAIVLEKKTILNVRRRVDQFIFQNMVDIVVEKTF